MSRIKGLSAVVALGLVLTGCGVGGGVAEESPAATTSSPAATASSNETNEPSAAPSTSATTSPSSSAPASETADAQESADAAGAETREASSTSPAFGDTYEWENGLRMTISVPESFIPGEYSFGAEEGDAVMFTVTVENESDEAFDPNVIMISAASGGMEAEEIYDHESGLEGGPTTTVPVGRSIKYQIGYAVADPADIIMDVAPGFEYDSATFTS